MEKQTVKAVKTLASSVYASIERIAESLKGLATEFTEFDRL